MKRWTDSHEIDPHRNTVKIGCSVLTYNRFVYNNPIFFIMKRLVPLSKSPVYINRKQGETEMTSEIVPVLSPVTTLVRYYDLQAVDKTLVLRFRLHGTYKR